MASILITGGNGFIAQHLYAALKEEHELTTLDLYGYSRKPPSEYDGIIHLAAVSRVSVGERDPVMCMGTNIIETVKMMEIPHKWFIFASSCEKPKNVYGLSKRSAEDYIKLRGGNYAILRLSNVYGPGMSQDKLIARLHDGENLPLSPHVLPLEYIHVIDVVAQIKQAIGKFGVDNYKPYTLKLATGIARTRQELKNVAASY